MSFDPALVAFECSEHYGPSLRYDGLLHFPHGALPGLRYKFPFREEGFIIKAEVLPRRTNHAHHGQGTSEWVVWESLPDDLRPMFAALHCHAAQRVDDSTILWTAQAWVDSVRTVARKDANAAYTLIRTYGYKPRDIGPQQLRRPPGSPYPIFIDWGHWELPRRPRP